MNLLIVIVNEPQRAEDFFSALMNLDVEGMQVVDSASVMSVLAREAPIFAGLRDLVTQPTAESKTIYGFTEDGDVLKKLKILLGKVGIDLDAPGTGYAMLVSLADWTGNREMG